MVKKEKTAVDALTDSKKKHQITFDQLYAALVREGEALKLNNKEREVAVALNRMEEQLKRSLTETERKMADAQLRLNQQLQIQADILDQVQQPVQQYKDTLAALNTLLDQGRISIADYNSQLSQTQLGQGLKDLRISLNPDEFAGQLQTLQDQLTERQLLLQQAREAELISEQEYHKLSTDAARAYNQGILDMENQRMSMQYQIGESTFGQLAQLTKAYIGEQSTAYQILFGISKAFAVADAIVQIQGALAKAANSGPFPANLGAIASVAAATGRLISTITSTNLSMPSFQNGGSFRVGGAGGTDSQLVQFRASPNETVSIRTPGQQDKADRTAPAESKGPQQMPPIFNVIDQNVFTNLLNTPAGRGAFINFISADSAAINQALGR